MARWNFWGDKEFSDVYENVYIRSVMEDWYGIVWQIVKRINTPKKKSTKKILDVGCGEGHSTKQILDRIKGRYICDLLEPDRAALATAEAFLTPENKIGGIFPQTLATFIPRQLYDVIFTSHTNYYWALNEKDYRCQLDKLLSMLFPGGRLMILTLPSTSDHYRIMLRQIYPAFNYAEYITKYYRKLGTKVEVQELKMRMYVGDILSTNSQFDLKTFYRFIHNTDSYPNQKESDTFLSQIKKYQVKNYLNFRDHLITITKA